LAKYVCVLAGGGVGALLRFMVASAVAARFPSRFPLGTFLINVTGSFAIGFLMTLFVERYPVHENWRLLLVTGVLGGYTTFSSFEYEALVGLKTGNPQMGFFYVALSVFSGFCAVWLGSWLVPRR
jgi:fluoride exporter